jgi:NAD(P)-dependent dehydrogenase (short-subunit alcohol dehydrogenase family)
VLQTNVIGVWLSVKHCVAPMQARGGGSIMCTSSAAGVIGFPGVAPYVSSKHAVCGFVKTAALELAESGIRVNAINPGPIDNRMIRSLEEQLSPDDPDAVRADITESVPLKRYGTDEEVAKLALFLGSDESSFCTGSIFMIDGGFTAA